MALIDDVKQICDRLAPLGWGALLPWHGLNIAAADLAGELERPLTGIRREIAGFGTTFHGDTTRAVEPWGGAVCSITPWQVAVHPPSMSDRLSWARLLTKPPGAF